MSRWNRDPVTVAKPFASANTPMIVLSSAALLRSDTSAVLHGECPSAVFTDPNLGRQWSTWSLPPLTVTVPELPA